MHDNAAGEAAKPSQAVDRYGEVALGVECAWPEENMKIRLTRGKAVPVRGAAGRTVHAHEGLVWITEEKAAEDILLRAGESFRLARPGLAVVEAFRDASISID